MLSMVGGGCPGEIKLHHFLFKSKIEQKITYKFFFSKQTFLRGEIWPQWENMKQKSHYSWSHLMWSLWIRLKLITSTQWYQSPAIFIYQFVVNGCFQFRDYLNQGSQTCGPRECPMRPANTRKNENFKGNNELFCLFFKINWFLTQFNFFIFMRPARPYFESHAARESFWVWDPLL